MLLHWIDIKIRIVEPLAGEFVIHLYFVCQLVAVSPTSGLRKSSFFSHCEGYWCATYHRSVLIKIYPLCLSEPFHLSLLLFLFDWPSQELKTLQERSISCSSFCILYLTNGQIHVNMIINALAVKSINNSSVTIVCIINLQTTGHV